MNDFWNAQLRARQVQEDTGISLADQAKMPLDEWSRLAYGMTPVQAALRALDAQQSPQAPQEVSGTPQAPESDPVGIDVSQLTIEQYAALRGQLGIGKSRQEGRGIFDSVGSRSQAYTDAARQQAGRTGWSTSNVVESPRLTNRHMNHDERRDTRTAGERFGTPGNSFQI